MKIEDISTNSVYRTFNPLQYILIRLVVIIILSLGLNHWSIAAEYRLRIENAGLNPGGDCSDSTHGYLAGMYPALVVEILPIGRDLTPHDYVGVTDREWPSGIEIQAGYYREEARTFSPDPSLTNLLGLRYYVDHYLLAMDSLWRTKGKIPNGKDLLSPRFYFSYYLPENLIGRNICFKATYHSEQYGNITSETPLCISIFKPCSAMDTTWIRMNLVHSLYNLSEWQQLLVVTDSLESIGYSDGIMLGRAMGTAERLKQFDRAIAYADTCFARFGTLTPGLGNHSGPIRKNPEDRRSYEEVRNRLLQEKAEYEQQQK